MNVEIRDIIMTLVTAGITTAVAIIGYYFKRNEIRLDKKDNQLEEKIEKTEQDLAQYKLEAEKRFVAKDEFIRSISHIDKKLDKVYDEIVNLKICKESRHEDR